jgi:hypothetical protein
MTEHDMIDEKKTKGGADEQAAHVNAEAEKANGQTLSIEGRAKGVNRPGEPEEARISDSLPTDNTHNFQ